MTEPDERLPDPGTAEPSSEHDPEAAEEYAESVPIDPAPDEVAKYLEIVGDEDAVPADPDPEDLPLDLDDTGTAGIAGAE